MFWAGNSRGASNEGPRQKCPCRQFCAFWCPMIYRVLSLSGRNANVASPESMSVMAMKETVHQMVMLPHTVSAKGFCGLGGAKSHALMRRKVHSFIGPEVLKGQRC